MTTRVLPFLFLRSFLPFPSFLPLVFASPLLGPAAHAQTAGDPLPARLAILAAEDRRAPTPRDLAVIRAGVRSADGQTARVAVRALGRLERSELVSDILPSLRHPLPEIRAEAANAVAQALHPPPQDRPRSASSRAVVEAASVALISRLNIEGDASVRAALAEALGRLPYDAADQVKRAEEALLELRSRHSALDRLGLAQGLEGLARRSPTSIPLSPGVLEALADLANPFAVSSGSGGDPAREARVRRVALGALTMAGAVDAETIRRAAADPDAQVRRLAMRAASRVRVGAADGASDVVGQGLGDPSPMVRLEALRAERAWAQRAETDGDTAGDAEVPTRACAAALEAVHDPDPHVALAGIDQLAGCSSFPDAVLLLRDTVEDTASSEKPRAWHRRAHGLVALASASAPAAAAALPRFAQSRVWQLRMYAGRAAVVLKDRPVLEALAKDSDDNVREAAIEGLASVAEHQADPVYVTALAAGGYQVLRAAAIALAGTRSPDAAPALEGALRHLVLEGRDNSRDARVAIVKTLKSLGVAAEADPRIRPARTELPVTWGWPDLARLASARVRVTVKDVGRFDLAMIALEAPASALRFARLVDSGYYNGLTFHRVVPNFVVQGGSPGANEYIGDAAFMRDELGQWPHVRGAVGISTRGRDTGDAQIFIDLVDNPRLDHEFTVFAQVLAGMDVVDALLEGDVIEKVEIIGR